MWRAIELDNYMSWSGRPVDYKLCTVVCGRGLCAILITAFQLHFDFAYKIWLYSTVVETEPEWNISIQEQQSISLIHIQVRWILQLRTRLSPALTKEGQRVQPVITDYLRRHVVSHSEYNFDGNWLNTDVALYHRVEFHRELVFQPGAHFFALYFFPPTNLDQSMTNCTYTMWCIIWHFRWTKPLWHF